MDKTIILWDVAGGKPLHTLPGFPSWVDAVAISADGRRLASVSLHEVSVWDLADGRKLRTSTWPSAGLGSVAFSPDGRTLATGISDGTVKLWNVKDGKGLRTLSGDADGEVSSVAFSPDGRTLVASRWNAIVELWDVSGDKKPRTLGGQTDAVESVAYSPDGTTLASGGEGGAVRIWDLTGGSKPLTLTGHSATANSVVFSPDGRTLASGSSDHTVRLWDVTGGRSRTLADQDVDVRSVSFSPDGQTLASGYAAGIRLWSVATGEPLRTLAGEVKSANPIVFSSDGQTLAFAEENAVELWNAVSDKEIRRLGNPDEDYAVEALAVSPDGRTLASGSFIGEIGLWDMASGTLLHSFTDPGIISALAFSPDGRMLASGSSDHAVRLWDVADGTALRRLAGDPGWVESVAFSADGRTLAAGAENGALTLWRVADGVQLATLTSFRGGRWVVTDPEGRFDTEDLEDMPYLHWVVSDDPFTPLPLELFMRDYYEPRLLSRILNGETLKPVRDLRTLNRVQPVVKIIGLHTVPGQPNALDVSVEATGASRRYQPQLPEVETAAHDLRVFRNGQLVGHADGVLAKAGKEPFRKTFRVRLPAGKSTLRFTAYAFNDDRVKSNTTARAYTPPAPIRATTARAYVITVGVNHHENSAWDLHYAANDARFMSEQVVKRLGDQNRYQDIVPIVLISDAHSSLATKADLKAVLDRLAGRPADVANIPNAERLHSATPDDFVLISFSGHGVDDDGEFYIIPGDTGAGVNKTVTKELLAHAISSNELADWLRDVDGGDMAMIIDACQSAASVGADFKPGPMGARGLGQLAYEKGMRILAASQAEASAGESGLTQQGLLTYALVHDGLDRGKADYKPPDGKITLSEWLGYGVERVPALAREVARGALNDRGAGRSTSNPRNSTLQQPALFDFTKNREDAVIVSAVRPP